MRKKPLILVAFLMMSLCMIPSVSAGYGDESPQSITSFSETLPDDVLFYPDSITSNIYFADSGEGDWENTFEKDEIYFNVTDGDDLDIHFVCNETEVLIEKWEYAIYGFEIDDDGNAKYYQYPGWTQFIAFTVTPSFYNGTIVPSGGLHGISNNYTLTLKFSIDYSATLCIDYVQIRFTYMTLGDSNHYTESFADVSDIPYLLDDGLDAGDYGGASDGDVWESWIVLNDTGNEYIFYQHILHTDLPGCEYYLDFNFKAESSQIIFQVYIDDDEAGVGIYAGSGSSTTSWTPVKVYLGAKGLSQISSVNYYFSDNPNSVDSGNLSIWLDHLRISPANETGWQHDGSTTAGASDDSVADMTYEYSTDGDILNMTATNTKGSSQYSWFYLAFDTTATTSDLENSYYPFFAANLKVSISDAGSPSYGVRPYYDDKLTTLIPTREGADYETVRANVAAGTVAYVSYLAFYCYLISSGSVTWLVDWAKVYSIANFTVTQGSCDTDEFLYVDNDVLVIGTTGETDYSYYFLLNYDPTLSVDTDIFNVWDVTVSPFNDYCNYKFNIGGWGDWTTFGETRGSLLSGELSDLQIQIAESMNGATISAIKFLDDHTWRGFTTVTVWFEVVAFTGTLGMLLIFGGLILIPASTLYAVKGGREEMNTDKLFYFLIAFVIGWALVIGGIYA